MTKKPTSMHDDVRLPRTFTDRLEACSLTDEEKQAIIEEAEKQVAKEQHAREKEEFMTVALRRARAKVDTRFEDEEVLVDLPGHAVHVMIDGVEYLHSFTYTLPRPVADTVREIIQRAWDHEDDVQGANRAFYHQPNRRTRGRGITLNRAHANLSAGSILRGN
jgi:hypothetical protein